MDHFAGGSTGAVFAITVARGAEAELRIGFVDGWHHLIRPTFEDKGTCEVVRCWRGDRGASTFRVVGCLSFLGVNRRDALMLFQFGLGLLEVVSL